MTSPIGSLAAKTLRTRHERTVFANRDELPMRVTKANKEIPAQSHISEKRRKYGGGEFKHK